MIFPPTSVAQAARLMHTAQVDELFEAAKETPPRSARHSGTAERAAGGPVALGGEGRCG